MVHRRAVLAAPALALAGRAAAQPRPVTIVVPFPPGGSTDLTARLVAERMAAALSQPVQVENRPGGATVIGAEAVARAAPDGHTLLMSSGTTLTLNPLIMRNLPYRLEDFAPVALVALLPFAIVARADGPRDLAALVERARARPGEVTYGTNGPSSFNNIAAVLVADNLGIRMQDITYRGDAQQVADFLGGRLDLLVVGPSTAIPLHRDGRARIIAFTGDRRMAGFEDIPLAAETRPEAVAQTWFGLLAPARTPRPAIERLNAAAVQAVRADDFRARMTAEGQFAMGGTPEEFADFLRREKERWAPVLGRMNLSG